MVLPLIPLTVIVGSGIAGAGGVVAGAVGGLQIRNASRNIGLHWARYEECHATHLFHVNHTNAVLQAFGKTQARAQCVVILRMRNFLERHNKLVRANEHLILEGIGTSNSQVLGVSAIDPDVAGWVRGVVRSVVAGGATRAAVPRAVKQFGIASTGTPISTLSGAARERSTLAFLGGKSLKAGGGGMKLGKITLNAATAGTSIFVAGLMVKNQGTKARTEADEQRVEVDVGIAQIERSNQLYQGIQQRARELDEILNRLMSQGTGALDLLESEPFNLDFHAERLQAALILVKAVRDVATASVVDDNGVLDGHSERFIFKYRDSNEEKND